MAGPVENNLGVEPQKAGVDVRNEVEAENRLDEAVQNVLVGIRKENR